LDKAADAMAEIKANKRTGVGPNTLAGKKTLALEAKQAEAGKRQVGRKRAEILAGVLNISDYRIFL
jgi:hypothetical protein